MKGRELLAKALSDPLPWVMVVIAAVALFSCAQPVHAQPRSGVAIIAMGVGR